MMGWKGCLRIRSKNFKAALAQIGPFVKEVATCLFEGVITSP